MLQNLAETIEEKLPQPGWRLSAALFFVFFTALYLHIEVSEVRLTFDLELVDVDKADFKVYWRGQNTRFSERESRKLSVREGRRQYTLTLPVSLSGRNTLRIDPLDSPGEITLHRLEISRDAFDSLIYDSPPDWRSLQPNKQFEVLDSASGYRLRATDVDPQLLLGVEFHFSGIVAVLRIVMEIVIIGLLCGVFFLFVMPRIAQLNFVPLLGLSVLALVLIMAAISPFDGHPDEYVHLPAVDFYKNHWLPPDMNSASVESSFSIYGVSRLYSYEAYYLLAGYLSRVLSFFDFEVIRHGRFFNALLFFGLLVWVWRHKPARYFVLPLMVSAQAWYLFSYANSDALGLFLCTVLAYQVAYEKSGFNQYLQQPDAPWLPLKTLAWAMLFGLILLTKQNYYFFALFMGLFLLWRVTKGEFDNTRLFWQRIILIGVLALSPFCLRFALDVTANGWERDQLFEELREVHADPAYKPSTELHETAGNLYLKDKGISANDLLEKYYWSEILFRSAFGKYGYMQYSAEEGLYDWIRYSGVALLCLIVVGILRSFRLSTYILLGITGIVACSLIGMSFYQSWTTSFQPQGRYMMPILPMLAILYYRCREKIWQSGVIALSLWMCLLGLYSFTFIGIGSFWQ